MSSITTINTVSVILGNSNVNKVKQSLIDYTIPDSDYTIESAVEDSSIGIFGIRLITTADITFQLKSNSTIILEEEYLAYNGFVRSLQPSLIIATAKGEDLVVNCSAAIKFVLFYSSFNSLNLN